MFLRQTILTTALLLGLPVAALAQAPVAVATFESVGVTWPGTAPLDPNGGAQVQFRKAGDTAWEDGLPLWFDSRENQYRGSLVHLASGTSYQVKVTRDDSFTQTVTTQTWPRQFPIARTVTLPASSNTTLTITESGSPSGYVLYTAPAGSSSTIDVAKQQDFDVRIQASYVIVRGLTLKGAKRHAIVVGDGSANPAGATDVIIENNDISAWGSVSPDSSKFGRDDDSAIYSAAPDLARVVIQRNRLHHPSFDANSREEKHGSSSATRGPVAINLNNSAGNLVIRYNEIYSDATHYFRDGIEGGPDFSDGGFPNRDSDIYGNTVANVWDDAINAAGANRNVRVWGNYVDQVYSPIGMAPNYGGPIYIWKNISHSISSGPGNTTEAAFLKIRNIDTATGVDWGGGRTYLFNNTSLIPRAGSGLSSFITRYSGADPQIRNLRTLNNVMMVRGPTYFSISAASGRNVAFDYDLFNGKRSTPAGQELHGIQGVAKLISGWGFDPVSATGVFALETASPGYDGGVEIPNFVTEFTGRAPDMGAHEALTAPLQFGINAYVDDEPPPPPPPAGILQFSAATYSVGESGPSASITITRSGGSSGAASVKFQTTTGGTATAGSDYTGVSTTLNWADGEETTQTVSIPIINDAVDEADTETVSLLLSNVTGAVLGATSAATLNIIDNDQPLPSGTVQFVAVTYTVNESGPTAKITVSRSDGSSGAASVKFQTTTGGTATAGSDYTGVSTTLNWADGEETTQTVSIPIINDAVDEADTETVSLLLSNVTGASLGAPSSATLSIVDNDAPPSSGTVQFVAATYTVAESGSTAKITVSRSGGSSGAASVRVQTIAGGTASAGSDYSTVSTTLNWTDGQNTTKTVSISIVDDSADEADTETVKLVLNNVTGASLGTTVSATLNITDNDEPNPGGPSLRVMLVGDSTVTDQRGWGLGFAQRASDNITVVNRAVSGTSSKSYRDLGYWNQALAQNADYVLIQFGHNDQPDKPPEKRTDPQTTYKANMTRYVDEARAAGINPILVTSLTRRYYDSNGRIRTPSALTPYVEVVRALAPSLSVPLIDLNASSIAFFNLLGPNGWQQYAPPGDETHLNSAGSYEVSRLVVQDLPSALRPYFHTR